MSPSEQWRNFLTCLFSSVCSSIRRAQTKNADTSSDFQPRIITARPSSWQSSGAPDVAPAEPSGTRTETPAKLGISGLGQDSSARGGQEKNAAGNSQLEEHNTDKTSKESRANSERQKPKKRTGRVVTASASRWKQKADEQEIKQKEKDAQESSSVFNFVTSLFG